MKKILGSLFVLVVVLAIIFAATKVVNHVPPAKHVVAVETKADKEPEIVREIEIIVPPAKESPPVVIVPEKKWKVRNFMDECVLENTDQGITFTEKGDIVLKVDDVEFKTFPRSLIGTFIGFYNADGVLIAKITNGFTFSYSQDSEGNKTKVKLIINGSRQRTEMFKNLSYIQVEGVKYSLEGSLEGYDELKKCLTNK